MTVRRQLINLSDKSIELRLGFGAFSELSRYFKGVVSIPKRAVLVCDERSQEAYGETVERSLVDAGFSVEKLILQKNAAFASFDRAGDVFGALARAQMTADDLVVGMGDAYLCSLVAWCARSWYSGAPCALLPTTFDAMITAALSMKPLICSGAVSLQLDPEPELVACDLDIVANAERSDLELGYVEALASMVADSKKAWDDFCRIVPGLLRGEEISLIDAVGWSQSARLDVRRAPSPGARCGLDFGRTCAAALFELVSPLEATSAQLLAEGLRLEARLAFDTCGFDIDDVYAIDDCLADLGIDEIECDIDADDLVAAVRKVQFARSNRAMFALPHAFGAIRLAHVDDETLDRHVRAFADSRSGLL